MKILSRTERTGIIASETMYVPTAQFDNVFCNNLHQSHSQMGSAMLIYYVDVNFSEPQPQIIWEVPTEDVIVKRLQESPTGRFMLRMWPSSPPSRPSTKRYLPYHPVARFRGVSPPDTRSAFSLPRGYAYRNEQSERRKNFGFKLHLHNH